MRDLYFEEIGIFTIEYKKVLNNTWNVVLKTPNLLVLVTRFDEKEKALIFFDTKCQELKNLLRDWYGFG